MEPHSNFERLMGVIEFERLMGVIEFERLAPSKLTFLTRSSQTKINKFFFYDGNVILAQLGGTLMA